MNIRGAFAVFLENERTRLDGAYRLDLLILETAFPGIDRQALLDYCLEHNETDLFRAHAMMEAVKT